MKKKDQEELLEDIFQTLGDMIARLESEKKGLFNNCSSHLNYIELSAKRDALNSLKSYILGRTGKKTLRLD